MNDIITIPVTPTNVVINKLKNRKRYATGKVQGKIKKLLEGINSPTTFSVAELYEKVYNNKSFRQSVPLESAVQKQFGISIQEMMLKGELTFKVMKNMGRDKYNQIKTVSYTFIPMDLVPKIDGKKLFEDWKTKQNTKTLIKNPFINKNEIKAISARKCIRAMISEKFVKKEESIQQPVPGQQLSRVVLRTLVPEVKTIKLWLMNPSWVKDPEQWKEFVNDIDREIFGNFSLRVNNCEQKEILLAALNEALAKRMFKHILIKERTI
jgi:hypothetical protein